MKPSEIQINQILNINLNDKYWILQLGIGYVYENVPSGIKYFYPYDIIGKKFWKLLKGDVYDFICNEGKPKQWIDDIITGDTRNLIVGLVAAITSKYEVTLGIAVPIVALILKSGVIKYCENIDHRKTKIIHVKKIIEDKILLTMPPKGITMIKSGKTRSLITKKPPSKKIKNRPQKNK